MSVFICRRRASAASKGAGSQMTRTKSTDPLDRLGVYKHFEEVPQHHRLCRNTADYAGRDVWDEFCTEHEYQQGSSDHFQRDVDRVGDHWCRHMDARGRHHALAQPEDVETWCDRLITNKTLSTSYNYWVRIKRFYDWLVWHTDHPHRYDPVLMAVAEGGAAGEIWEQKLQKWSKVRGRATNE